MQLDPIERDLEGFHDEFIVALADANNRIYVDTSLLMWLVRVGSGARKEFIEWAAAKGVQVPVWAAHEFHRHIVAKTELDNVRKTVSETDSKYVEFVKMANERADDAACAARGYIGRDDFVGELEQSLVRLKRMITVIEPQEVALRAVMTEVVEFVNNHVMKSNIDELISGLTPTVGFRASHLMPPGFQDSAKEENPYGDVVIWEEIVADIKNSSPPAGLKRHAILISRDKKTDWVSGARVVKGPRGEYLKPLRDVGLDVMLAHPLLVHEFKTRTGEVGDKFYVTLPGTLAGAVAYSARKASAPHKVHQWLSASYRPDFLKKGLASAAIGTPVTPPASTAAAAVTSAWVARESPSALTPKRIGSIDLNSEVGAFTSASPSKQEELMQAWVTPAGGLSPVKLGRLLAELAKAGASDVSERIPALTEAIGHTMDDAALGALLLGVAVPAYFDRHGDLLPQPHRKLGVAVLALARGSRSGPAVAQLRKLLKEVGAHLPFMPGDTSIRWSIVTPDGRANGPKMIKDIRIGSESAWVDNLPGQSPRRLSALLSRSPSAGCIGAELRNLVGREFLIPPLLLTENFDSQRYTWPNDAGLVTMDTESEGGLSVGGSTDEGETDE